MYFQNTIETLSKLFPSLLFFTHSALVCISTPWDLLALCHNIFCPILGASVAAPQTPMLVFLSCLEIMYPLPATLQSLSKLAIPLQVTWEQSCTEEYVHTKFLQLCELCLKSSWGYFVSEVHHTKYIFSLLTHYVRHKRHLSKISPKAIGLQNGKRMDFWYNYSFLDYCRACLSLSKQFYPCYLEVFFKTPVDFHFFSFYLIFLFLKFFSSFYLMIFTP